MSELPKPNAFNSYSLEFKKNTQFDDSEPKFKSEILKEIQKQIEKFENKKHIQTSKNEAYKDECLKIVPLWVWQQTTQIAIQKFKNITSYDFKYRILIIKIHDYDENLISYKRRRYNEIKWCTAKDTHPNNQCLVDITSEDKHIYCVEGHHDLLTALLIGIDVLMIPSVNYKSFNDYEVSLLKNRDVIFIADYKNDDLSGVNVMRKLALQVDDIARNTKVFSLPKFLKDENISFTGSKLDLSEVVELWNDGLEAFVNRLDYRADKGIFYDTEELF